MTLRILTGALSALLVSGLVGCTSAARTGQPEPGIATSSAADATALPPMTAASSEVTRSDYEEAVQRAGACMADQRVQMANSGWDPVSNQRMLIGWDAPEMSADESGAIFRKCKEEYLVAVEARYSAQHAAHMSPELMTAVRGCLADQGVTVKGGERTAQDLMESVPEKSHTKLYNCVHKTAYEIFPNLQAVSFP